MLMRNPLKSFLLPVFPFLISVLAFLIPASGQTPNQIINTVNQRFNRVNDYTADVNVNCEIPAIKINSINAKVIYRKPDKFKIKSTGILILPKQQANFFFTTIADTTQYTAVKTGEEMIDAVKTHIVNVIPNKDTSDLILGKFWIDAERGLVLKSQLTTKSQGTIFIENSYSSMSQYSLPDKMLFIIETQKFKLPKAVAMDINSSSTKKQSPTDDGKGRITLTFSNYIINKGVSSEQFK
jgi:outer membrane lipoprotein-sorting protein